MAFGFALADVIISDWRVPFPQSDTAIAFAEVTRGVCGHDRATPRCER
jgi:hypothetical protein